MTQNEIKALYAAIPQVAGNGAAAAQLREMLTSLLYAALLAQPPTAEPLIPDVSPAATQAQDVSRKAEGGDR